MTPAALFFSALMFALIAAEIIDWFRKRNGEK